MQRNADLIPVRWSKLQKGMFIPSLAYLDAIKSLTENQDSMMDDDWKCYKNGKSNPAVTF